MGWITTHKPKHIPATEYLLRHSGALSWGPDCPTTYTVLATAIVNLKTFYAAVERVDKATGAREVWAAVFLINFWRGEENFGWKDMDETMGPCEATAPARILDLLTPTDNVNALNWRERCRFNIARQSLAKEICPGAIITLYGKPYKVEKKLEKAWLIYRESDRQPFRLTAMKARQITAIELPKEQPCN